MRSFKGAWLLAAACAFLLLQLSSAAPIRGLNPEFASKYTGEKGVFQCLDGSKTIPFTRVNDDYCDCADGSDEPGTPACYNGRFYCRNLGHESKLLSTSFVDDGICDCCDGSDEPKGSCKNSCLQASAQHKENLKAQVDHFAQALQKKSDLVKQAQEKLAEWKGRQQVIDTEIESQKASVATLKVEKEKAEAEAAQRAAEEQAAADQAQAAEEAAAAAQEAQHADGAAAGEENKEETAEEIGRRIASQWTNDPAAAATGKEGEQVNEEEGHEEHFEHEEGGDPEDPASQFYEAERRLSELEKEKLDLDRYLGGTLDYGPNNMFLPLAGTCYSAYQTRWTYEACLYGEASQSEGYSNKVIVGRFKGFENNYSEMVFGDGDYCGGVGPRTFRVKLSCGLTEELKDVEEPATCQYTAHLTTPLLCTADDLAKVQAQLEHVIKTESEILAMIEAQDKQEL